MNDELNVIWNNLSYTVQKKSEKILRIKKEMDVAKRKTIPSLGTAGALFGLYIMPNGLKYVNTVIPVSAFGQIKPKPINFFDITILLITVISVGYYYLNASEVKQLKSKYEKLRKNLMETMDNEFCNHERPSECQCKDTYIKGMEREKIDLIFD